MTGGWGVGVGEGGWGGGRGLDIPAGLRHTLRMYNVRVHGVLQATTAIDYSTNTLGNTAIHSQSSNPGNTVTLPRYNDWSCFFQMLYSTFERIQRQKNKTIYKQNCHYCHIRTGTWSCWSQSLASFSG